LLKDAIPSAIEYGTSAFPGFGLEAQHPFDRRDMGGICVRDYLLDDQAFQVLKSFRPYFGERGNDFLSALENIQELLGSEPAKKVAESLRFFGVGDKYDYSLDAINEAAPNPYNLFLILGLMFAADIPGVVKSPKNGSAPDSIQGQLPAII
jgi:hypothetical protein